MTAIATPLDLWQHLCTGAGLELRLKSGGPGRDADIEIALRKALGVPATAHSLAAWLASDTASPAPSVSTEHLLIEVLKSQGGFALMMRDILDVLNTAEARQASHHLSVEFKFDKVTDPIKTTLEQFREAVQRVQRVLEKRPELPNNNVMWPLSERLRGFLDNASPNRPEGFPPVFAIASTGNPRIDSHLELLVRLVSDFRALWREYGATRKQVGEAARSLHPDGADVQVLRGQLYAATDFWDIGVLEGAQELSRQVMSGQLTVPDAVKHLDEALLEINWVSDWVEHTVQELLDLLKLPAWRRRHELYSVWVGTRLLDVVARTAPDMHFHPVDGVLSFEFGGSRLASFSWDGKQFDIWAELRSGLVGSSTKRKKGIQPDFRVLKTDLSKSSNAQTVYVLECKHYIIASKSNFVQAASDYSRSCPNATVHVVNHGPADEQALTEALPTELRSKAGFIGGATPQQEAMTGGLRQAIQSALFPGRPPPARGPAAAVPATTSALAPGLVGRVQLEWDESLNDMDLALRIVSPHGQITQSIDFRTIGALDAPPFAQFDNDVRKGPGAECIDVGAWNFDRYELVATNYSKMGRMTPEALRCRIVTDQGLTLLRCPEGLTSATHEWKIAELQVSDGVVTVIQCN